MLVQLAPIVFHNNCRSEHVLHLDYEEPGLHVAGAVLPESGCLVSVKAFQHNLPCIQIHCSSVPQSLYIKLNPDSPPPILILVLHLTHSVPPPPP